MCSTLCTAQLHPFHNDLLLGAGAPCSAHRPLHLPHPPTATLLTSLLNIQTKVKCHFPGGGPINFRHSAPPHIFLNPHSYLKLSYVFVGLLLSSHKERQLQKHRTSSVLFTPVSPVSRTALGTQGRWIYVDREITGESHLGRKGESDWLTNWLMCSALAKYLEQVLWRSSQVIWRP